MIAVFPLFSIGINLIEIEIKFWETLVAFLLCQALENEGMDMEIDLSNLGTVNTMFAALFR